MSAQGTEPAGHRDAAFGYSRRDGRVLLVRNGRLSQGAIRSWWDLPGGAVRRGEGLAEALRREWTEETGLSATVGDLRLVLDGVKRRPAGPVLYTWRAFFFDVDSGGTPVPGAGIDEALWVPESDVPAKLSAPYHAPLRRHLEGDPARHARVEWVEEDAPTSEGAAVPRHLLVLAAAAAVGACDLMGKELASALSGGVMPKRILETLLQVVPYAGYPRAITALGVARGYLDDVMADPEQPPGDAHARGREVFERVYGAASAHVLRGLEAREPVLARWTIEHAYGRVLCREGVLTLLERELLAVSILTALGGLEAPLLGHMRAVLRLGGNAEQLRAAVQVVPAAFGEEKREAARMLLTRL